MAKIKGVCKNIDEECGKALGREVQELEQSAPFVCEECGKPLIENKDGNKTPGGGSKLPIIIIAAVILLGGIGFGVYRFILKPEPPKPAVVIEAESEPVTTTEEKEATISEPETIADTPEPVVGATSGTVNVSGGVYKGELKNGKPDGLGTITYSSRALISPKDMKKRHAEAGDYVTGQFKTGEVVSVKWYDKGGNSKGTVTP